MLWIKAHLFQKYETSFVSGRNRTDYSKCPPAGQPCDFVIVVCKRQSSERMLFLAGREWSLKVQCQLSDILIHVIYEEEKYEGLSPWAQSFLRSSPFLSYSQEIPHILWNPRFTTALEVVPTTCPYPEPDQSSPCPPPPSHFLKIYLNIILPPKPGSSKWYFPSGFPTKTLYTPFLFPMCATCPDYLILLDLITQQHWVRSTDY